MPKHYANIHLMLIECVLGSPEDIRLPIQTLGSMLVSLETATALMFIV